MADNDESRPVACTLSEDQAAERGDHVQSELVPRYLGATELEEGYSLRFSGTNETLTAVAEFVGAELECCSFAEYQFAVSPPYEETQLTIRGPEGTKDLFGQEFVTKLEAASPLTDGGTTDDP